MGVGLALDHSGDVVVTGMHEGYLGQLAGPVDAFIQTLDGTTGTELSLHLFGTHQTDRAETVVVEQDGRYLWLGGDNSGAEPTYIDTRVRRLDANSGAISLDRHYYPTGLDRHVAGDLIPLGSQEYAMGGMRWTLARIFVSGHAGADFNENWYQEYQGSAWGTTLSGMVVAPDGRIIVAGHALNDGDGRGAANTDPFLLFFRP